MDSFHPRLEAERERFPGNTYSKDPSLLPGDRSLGRLELNGRPPTNPRFLPNFLACFLGRQVKLVKRRRWLRTEFLFRGHQNSDARIHGPSSGPVGIVRTIVPRRPTLSQSRMSLVGKQKWKSLLEGRSEQLLLATATSWTNRRIGVDLRLEEDANASGSRPEDSLVDGHNASNAGLE